MQKILFESYTIEKEIVSNPCPPLGFENSLMSLVGYTDPMRLSAVFSGLQRITNAMGMMPWELKPFHDTDIPPRHWFYTLFDNCLQTQFLFTKNIIKDVIAHGNGYALIQRDDMQHPINLVYLPFGTCAAEIDTIHNKMIYRVAYNNLSKIYEAKDIIHVVVNSNDGLLGKSLFDYADKSVKLTAYTEKAALQYFGSGMRLTGILSTDTPRLTDKQREEIRSNYLKGINSESGTAVLEAGMRFEQLSNNAKDAQLIDTRQYNVQEWARWYTMAPTVLGDFSHNIYGTIEAGSIDFVQNTCGPYVISLEQELNRKLLSISERKKFYISLNQDILIKSDRQTYANYISTFLDKGILSKNEAREMIGMPRIENGDSFILPYSGQQDSNGNITPSYNNSKQGNNANQNTNIENDKPKNEERTDN